MVESSEKGDRAPQPASSSDSRTEVDHMDHSPPSEPTALEPDVSKGTEKRLQAAHKLQNPLAGLSPERLVAMAEEYCREHGIEDEEDVRAFRLGAVIAGNTNKFDTVADLTDAERESLEQEITHRWRNPWMLYAVITVCSLCAAVQGMDETVVNGAQSFYKGEFGISGTGERDTWLLGLVNSAPYLCCALIGCWLTSPMNKLLGRRGTVFVSCLISALACFWQAFTNTWWHMFIARFVLGFGIGPKSATTPIFAAECAPPKLRGALVMQWQMWTAFGIMLGYAADLAFYYVPDYRITGLQWRLMMGSAMIPAVIVCFLVYFTPESPRWYLTKNRHRKAYESICSLRFTKVQAARDLFYANALLQVEREMLHAKGNRVKEFFTTRRTRNAMIASEIVIAYYSSEIFLEANFPEVSALVASLGFGIINWLFAIPALFTIDNFGRRNLLLTTFPLMSLFLFFTGFSFWIPQTSPAHVACIALGIYLFGMAYSPGEGPVPFTYSAEAYPLDFRSIGMSLATATTWFFNFVLSVTWPSMLQAFTPQGAFGWYAGWNIILFFLILFFMPETKEKTLEELDAVFSVPLTSIMRYGWEQMFYFPRRYILRQPVQPPEVPLAWAVQYHKDQFSQEKEHQPTNRV